MFRHSALAELIKRNRCLYIIAFYIFTYIPQQVVFFKNYFIARKISYSYDFKTIRNYRNMYEGQKCFIVGTAPSLSMDDLEQIRGVVSFSCNSIVLAFDQTDWRPDFYCAQDSGVNKLYKLVQKYRHSFKNIFVGVSDAYATPNFQCECSNYILQRLDHSKRGVKHKYAVSSRADKFVYDGYSITFSMMQLAIYMGFKNIILLGIDCDYSKKMHFIDYTDECDINGAVKMYKAYEYMKRYAEQNSISIFNASRGWKLDVFKCINIEEALRI